MSEYCKHKPKSMKRILYNSFFKAHDYILTESQTCKNCGIKIQPKKFIYIFYNLLKILNILSLIILVIFNKKLFFIPIIIWFILPLLFIFIPYEEVELSKPKGNNGRYVYNAATSLSIEDFKNLTVYRQLKGKKKVQFIRESNGHYYTIYSIKGGKLVYVELSDINFPRSAIYIKDIYEYPFSSKEKEEKLRSIILEKDDPEKILRTAN